MGSSLACFLYLSTVLSHICFAQNCADKTRCSSCDCPAVQTCRGSLRGRNGVFELPQGKRTSCLDCRWVLSVPNKRVRLTFSSFALGHGDIVKVYDGLSSSSPLIVTYTDGDKPVDLISSGKHVTVTFQSDSCGLDPVLAGNFRLTDSGKLVSMFPSKKRTQTQTITCPKPNFEYLLAFVSGETPLISANIKISYLGTHRSGDRVVVQKSLRKKTGNSRVFVASRSVRNWIRDVPGFTVSLISKKGTCGRGFQITVTSSSVPACLHPTSIPNGIVDVVNFGKTARYSCCSGFKLAGISIRSCVNGRWSPSTIPLCTRVDSCRPPENMTIDGKSQIIPLGSTAMLSCIHGYKLSHSLNTLLSLCDCNGNWNITRDPPPCQRYHCGPPPSSPISGSLLEASKAASGLYVVGSVVNYTCPDGYGLDGIPYRVCSDSLTWEPKTTHNTCIANYNVCPNPEVPQNGLMRARSFGHGHMVSFGCQRGFELEGTYERVCDATNPNDAYWTGVTPTCKSLFKSPELLAVQLKETFVDRTVSCTDKATAQNVSSTPARGQFNVIGKLQRPMECRGRAVVVGEGCIDLIYVVDCSKSVGTQNFKDSLEFVGRSSSLFDIDGGKARVTLITYDNEVHEQFLLRENSTAKETAAAISNATFCAGATATRKVLKFVRQQVLPKSRPECKRAIFLFSDGLNNWAGDPKNEADSLKKEKNLEIYTIAFGYPDVKIDTPALQSLASTPKYFYPVKDAKGIRRALDDAFITNVDYCQDCGIPLSPECNREANGECESKTGAWPWMVAIYRLELNKRNPVFHCGGTIIGDCWVLTAAHCLQGYPKEDFRVVVGETERYVKQYTEQTYSVEEVFIHPEFNRTGFNKDIGLLKLPCNITCSPFIRKGCLPRETDKNFYQPNTECIVAGWGATEKREHNETPGPKSTLMKELHLPIADHDKCIESTSPQYMKDVTEYTVCAGDGTGTNDPCNGDSGGPLFCRRHSDDRYVVVGIVSWGEGCGQPRKYGIFAHLLKLVNWVHKQMALYDCEPHLCPKAAKEIV